MKVVSAHSIRLGSYDGQEVEVFMDNDGHVLVQTGETQRPVASLLKLTMDAITAEALLRKHVD